MVSLNDIENNVLRPEFGYRTHAVLVCAARSCPPLQQNAYSAGRARRSGRDGLSHLARTQ